MPATLPEHLERLDGLRANGSGWTAKCPVHDDHHPSLSLTVKADGKVLAHCHAGCDQGTVEKTLGLSDERRTDGPEWTPHGDATAVYDYRDETGALLYQVLRTADKQFPQRRPDPTAKTGWRWNLGDTRRVPYRLRELIDGISGGASACVAEGEKDVEALRAHGRVATCNSGGAGKWRPEYAKYFDGADVTVFADKDTPGQAHARQVAASLQGVARSVWIVEAADPHKDISAHLGAGLPLSAVTITYRPDEVPKPDLAPDIYEVLAAADPDYDWLVPGLLERGERMMLTGLEGLGKALALDTAIPTPKGWTTMGALSVGDEIFGADGRPTRVIAATPVQLDRACYRVEFSDGAVIVADAEHRWATETQRAREANSRYASRPSVTKLRGTDQRDKRRHFPAVVTTAEIRDSLHSRTGWLNHSIATAAPLRYPRQELPLDPYMLGAWLGDGTSVGASITCAPDGAEILDRIRAAGIPVRRIVSSPYGWSFSDGTHAGPRHVRTQAKLRALGVLGNKHIPEMYLRGDFEQRLALLQGLMDTDGTISASANAPVCEFSVTSERLATDVHELLLGLGIKVKMAVGDAKLNGRVVSKRWRLPFQTDLPVFHLARKAERLRPLRTRRAKLRYIVAVEPVESVPVRCIQVDNDDHLYLAGRECIPTHNTMYLRMLAVCFAAGISPVTFQRFPPLKVLVVDCENSLRQNRRAYRPIVDRANKMRRLPEGGLRLILRPEGLNLPREDDAAWLLERVTAHRPDVLIIGPLYRLHLDNPNDEAIARRLVSAVDAARVKADCAVLIEAHAGHGEWGKSRAVRPVGSSLYLRWPEFGYGLRPARDQAEARVVTRVEVVPWRGPRDERAWPRELVRSEGWPWVPADDLPVGSIA